MLVGYGLSQLVNFLVQIGIVRYLTKSEYGAFAWALAAMLLVQAILPLGIDRASARFLTLYDERRDYGRLFGLIAIELIVILCMGVVIGGSAFVFGGSLENIAPSPAAVTMLLILIVLAPIQALDIILVEMFAVFASPWSVFMRRYVMEPLLRLSVVALLIVSGQGAMFLTVGFVVVGATGLTLYSILLLRMFRRIGLTEHFSFRTIVLPWREVGRFCGPVMLTSLVAVATTEFVAVVLGNAAGETEVAVFRAVLPFALLNLGVLYTFTTLFTPSAARLLARGQRHSVRDLYWQSAMWVAVLTFPVLGVTTALAAPFTVLTLGSRYESSATILMILSLGYYINAACGFNGFTIQLLGRSRRVLAISTATLIIMVITTFVLVPKYWAVGAALSVLITLIVHNLLKQLALGFGAGIGILNRSHSLVLLQVALAVGGLFVIQWWLRPRFWVGLVVVFATWMILLRVTRHSLRLMEVFPEAEKVPGIRWLLSTVAKADQVDPDSQIVGEEVGDAGVPPLAHWRLIDWRFLVPVGFARVGYRGAVSRNETRVLVESGVDVVQGSDRSASLDVLVATSADIRLIQADARTLRDGGYYLVRLGSRRQRPWRRIGRGSVKSMLRQLDANGIQSVGAYWHAPNKERCSYVVDLADRVALDAMLGRYHGVRFGRPKSVVTRALNRCGLIHLVARDVTIVGRKPLARVNNFGDLMPEAPTSTEPIRDLLKGRHSVPSTLLVTPWDEASRHVVALYFDPSTSELVSVAKFPRREWDTSGIEVEGRALHEVASDSRALVGHHPSLRGVDLGPRPYLLETAVHGEAVNPEFVRANLDRVLESGIDLVHRLAADGSSPGGLAARRPIQRVHGPDSFVRLVEEPLRRFATEVPLGPEAMDLVKRTLDLLAPLRHARLPIVSEHGDLSHPNLIMTSGGRMSAIDWERFELAGFPGHDITFFLQYVSEAKMGAVERHSQLVAFDNAFVGPAASTRSSMVGYLKPLGVDVRLLPHLVLSTWARTSAGFLERLAPMHSEQDAALADPAGLAEAFRMDRDFALWRHAVRRFGDILG
jgi:O-antigen/teichoic acid export membrane protein